MHWLGVGIGLCPRRASFLDWSGVLHVPRALVCALCPPRALVCGVVHPLHTCALWPVPCPILSVARATAGVFLRIDIEIGSTLTAIYYFEGMPPRQAFLLSLNAPPPVPSQALSKTTLPRGL